MLYPIAYLKEREKWIRMNKSMYSYERFEKFNNHVNMVSEIMDSSLIALVALAITGAIFVTLKFSGVV